MSGSRVKVIGVSVALLCIAAIIVQLASGNESEDSIYQYPEQPRAASSEVEPEAAAIFGLMRRSRQAGDGLAAANVEEGARQRGANPVLARRAGALATGVVGYLVQARGGVCLASDPPRLRGCSSYADAGAGRTAGALICSPALPSNVIEIFGLLPDGATDVRLRLSDGGTVPVRLVDNIYSVQVPRQRPLPATVEWNSPSGQRSVSAQVPPDAASDRCGPDAAGT
jgi:hypothetical protein